jgi:hypothetical protein
VGPKAGLDDVEKRKFLILPELELRSFGCPARSQSLYGLRYPGCQTHFNVVMYRTSHWHMVWVANEVISFHGYSWIRNFCVCNNMENHKRTDMPSAANK